MRPKLIRTEADFEAALERIETLMENDPAPSSPEGEELELLSFLVERYEDEKYPMDLPDPVSAIKFRMEQQALKNKDLVPFIGSPSKVSEVLSGQRGLSLAMIRNLVQSQGIPAEVLIGKPGAELKSEKELAELRMYPIAEMTKRGWFTGFRKHAPEAEVCKMAAKLRISPAIPAGRVRFERNNYLLYKGLVGNGMVRRHFTDWPN